MAGRNGRHATGTAFSRWILPFPLPPVIERSASLSHQPRLRRKRCATS